jgi:rhodanese-related sulfurtransferase
MLERLLAILLAASLSAPGFAQSALEARADISAHKAADMSTSELRMALARGDVLLLDARPRKEYAISHIPTALNLAPKPGLAPNLYVSDITEVARLVKGDKNKPLILYCNGPTCGKSRRLADELLAAGYSSVRRYQLGAPGWRLLGGALCTLPEALRYLASDKTAVWIDARSPELFAKGSLANARNIPASQLGNARETGVMLTAKQDGRLPMEDHNTRIIVFGAGEADARAVANAIFGEAFQNVSFVAEPFERVSRSFH